MFICFWEIAENTVFHKLLNISKEQVREIFEKRYWDRVKIKLRGDSFWSDGYFYESVGRVTSESVEYYIKRQQGKHWADIDFKVHKKPQSQKSLKDFFYG
jgi:REP element-mobilizing transposase RayT